MKPGRLAFATLLFSVLFFPLAAGPARAQVGANAQNDLWGENWGDDIWLWWDDQAGSAEYVMYRSTSPNGPWQEVGRLDADIALTGGPKIDPNPDARLKTLCYKLEALDAAGKVIRTYQPTCIPKYAGKQ